MVSNVLMPLLSDQIDQSLVKKHYQTYTLGHCTEQMFWENIGQPDYHDLRTAFLDSFELDRDVHKVIEQLRAKYQLAILSNLAKDWGEYLSQKFLFNEYFEPRVISGDVKCGKPNPTIYQYLLDQSDMDGEEILFIDDRLENLAIAHDLGMITVHYHREVDLHSYKADFTIHRLAELLDRRLA